MLQMVPFNQLCSRMAPLKIFLILTHFMPLISFCTLGELQKISGFLMFSGGIERDQWHEMG